MGKGYGAVFGPSGTGTFTTVQSLIKPFIGAGILAMPSAWADGGVVASSIMLAILAFVAGWAIFKLVECSDVIMMVEARHAMRMRVAGDKRMRVALESGMSLEEYQKKEPEHNADTFQDYFMVDPRDDEPVSSEDWKHVTLPTFAEIGACSFGPWGRRIVDYAIVIAQFGACIAYTIFISTNFGSVVSAVRAKYWVLIFFLPLLGLAVIKRIDKLAPASVLGNFVYIFTICVIFGVGFDGGFMPSKEINYGKFSKMPLVFGTCSFALEGIPLILPVKARMKTPTDFPRLMLIAMGIVSSLYLSFSVLCYLFFGNDTKAPVIDSMKEGALTNTVKISLAISLFFTFGLQVFPISSFFDSVVDDKLGIDLVKAKKNRYEEVRDILRANNLAVSPASSPEVTMLTPKSSPEPSPTSSTTALTPSISSSSLSSGRREMRLSFSNRNVDIVEEAKETGSLLSVSIQNTPSERFPTRVHRTHSESRLSKYVEEIHVPDNIRAYYPELHFKRRLYRFLVRLAIVCACCTVAIVFSDFKLIVALFGSLSNALLAYILPALFWIRVVASRSLFGFDYYPYDRLGRPLTHPMKARRDSSHETVVNGFQTDYGSNHDGELHEVNHASDALVPNAIAASSVKTLSRGDKCKLLWLATAVSVVGVLASIIGFVDALKEMINHFTK